MKNLNIISTDLAIHYEYDIEMSIRIKHDTFEGGDGTTLEILANENMVCKDAITAQFNTLNDIKCFGQFIINCTKDFENKLKTITK